MAGIRRPTIYCSADIVAALEDEELQAVLLHEHHHQLVRAPARLVVLSALRPWLGFVRPGAAWLERQRARIEVAADEHAIGSGATRAALARAIVKLQHSSSIAALARFASVSELRVRALLGEETPELDSATGARLSVISAAAAAAALCATLALR